MWVARTARLSLLSRQDSIQETKERQYFECFCAFNLCFVYNLVVPVAMASFFKDRGIL